MKRFVHDKLTRRAMCILRHDIEVNGKTLHISSLKCKDPKDPLYIEGTNWLTAREAMIVAFWLCYDLKADIPNSTRFSDLLAWSHSDLYRIACTLNDVYDYFRHRYVQDTCLREVKALVRDGNTGLSCAQLLRPVWSDIETLCFWSAEIPSTREDEGLWIYCMKRITQWCRCLYKIRFNDPSLEAKGLDQYLANEQRLAAVWGTEDPYRDELITEMRKVIDRYFDGYEPNFNHPFFGNGSCADPDVGRSYGLKALSVLQSNSALLNSWDQHFLPDAKNFLASDISITGHQKLGLMRHARFLFVPKSIAKLRAICMEPPETMFRQQAVREDLYAWLTREGSETARHFPLFAGKHGRRNPNCLRALKGSRAHDVSAYGTYDQSNASDNVAAPLVWQLFSHKRELRWALFTTRTPVVDLPNGDSIKVTKFAPMGSALCFPIQCVVFGALAEVTLKQAALDGTIPFSCVRDYVEFGDDLTTKYGELVLPYLKKNMDTLGFQLNVDKTFVTGPYRESCGIEAYYGGEIQPWYYRLPQQRERSGKAARFAALISCANHCFDKGYSFLRQYFIGALRTEYGEDLPFTNSREDSSSIFTTGTLWARSTRYHKGYQRVQVRKLRVVAVEKVAGKAYRDQRKHDGEQLYSLYQTLYQPSSEVAEDDIAPNLCAWRSQSGNICYVVTDPGKPGQPITYADRETTLKYVWD